MAKFTSKGVAPDVLERILNFLNNAKNTEDINSFGDMIIEDYDIGELVAQRILDKRDKLDGFKDLSELSDIKGFGIDKFNDLVAVFDKVSELPIETVYEPLFRFASLRYQGTDKLPATKSANRKTNTGSTAENKIRRLSKTELNELEKAHIASLAQESIRFINGLSRNLENLTIDYNNSKQEALKRAVEEYNKLIQNNIKSYEKGLNKEDKKILADKKKTLEENYNSNVKQTDSILETNVYPSTLFPSLEFNFVAFVSLEFLKNRLSAAELTFLEQNRLLNLDFTAVIRELNELIKGKRNLASFSNLKSKKKVAVGGVPVILKNRYKNGYALSVDKQNKTFHFSLITTKTKNFFTKANLSLEIQGKSFKSSNVKLIDNNTNKLFLEFSFNKLPELETLQSFTFEVAINLDSEENIKIKETVSSHNDIWVGQYAADAQSKEALRTKGGTPIKDLSGILKLGWADLMRVEQKLCCYLPGEVSHIENIMAREYKEKSTEYLERSESTLVEENETETISKNDTTSIEKNDWNKEISKTIEKNFNFGLGTTVSYGSENGPWSASINADMSIANSTSQSATNAQSYSKEITESASESIRVRSFEKRTTTLIKQFKEENKHGFDNRGGASHVSGVFRWIDKIYKNRIVNYGTGMLYEFMLPKPSELYVETLSAINDQNPPPEAPTHPGLSSWNEITRINFMGFITAYNVTDYKLPKDEIRYDDMSIGFINEPFDWDNQNKNEVVRTYQFNSVLANDYFLEAVLPNTLANTTDWKIRVHNPWQHSYARFQVSLEKAGTNPATIAYNNSFASRLASEEDVAGNVVLKDGLGYENSVDVRIYGSCVRYLSHLNLNFRFKLLEDSFTTWQTETYNAIMLAYQTQLDAYNTALALYQNDITNNPSATLYDANQYKHPGHYKGIINTELKRLCIELLLQDSNLNRCQEFYETTQCKDSPDCAKIPMLTDLDKLDEYSAMVKFLEQSFNWSLSSHNFYPYYWGGKCDWSDMLHNEDTPDNDFQKFLKSGMARVIVPVREGFEEVVGHFISTGEPWFDGVPPVIRDPKKPGYDPLYVSIVDELAKKKGTPVGKPWNTNVPSSLTLIQGDTVFLQNQGLPCCEESGGRNGISPSKNALVAKEEDPE